jgi:lysophospholipase L1-like esterase
VVDRHPAFPSRAPWLASQELVVRYALPRLFPALRAADPGTEGVERSPARVAENVATLEHMVERVRAAGARPIVLHVPQPPGQEPADEATRSARRELARRMEVLGVELVSVEQALVTAGGQSLFRDAFHPNPAGNAVLAAEVAGLIGAGGRGPGPGAAGRSGAAADRLGG